MLHLLTKKGRLSRERAKDLYAQVVKASRNPVFYTAYGIPDTMEGRFEMVCLHGGVLVNRLSRPDMGAEGRMLAQAFFDVMFINLDWSIREAGVGDLAVPRRIKKMMSEFKGRSFAYDEAVKAGGGEVEHALTRNLYPMANRHRMCLRPWRGICKVALWNSRNRGYRIFGKDVLGSLIPTHYLKDTHMHLKQPSEQLPSSEWFYPFSAENVPAAGKTVRIKAPPENLGPTLKWTPYFR